MASDPPPLLADLERLARLMRAGEHGEGLNPAQWQALRYLARANRFSNSPGALARYLGATKGTVSQTVRALERKGLLRRGQRPGEGRSIVLMLTPKAEEILRRDPWARLEHAAGELGGKTRRRLSKGLGQLLQEEIERSGLPSFGLCATCRFFRENGKSADPAGPHHCMFLDDALTPADAARVCAEHQAPA
ncbi:MAG: MarR family transcriptional regulator [Alphaproteobacteria bacterium]|nr:MarR family transcriptional regulator [Alphaproteobacteria bacterium]